MGFPGTGELGEVNDLNSERAYDAMAVHGPVAAPRHVTRMS